MVGDSTHETKPVEGGKGARGFPHETRHVDGHTGKDAAEHRVDHIVKERAALSDDGEGHQGAGKSARRVRMPFRAATMA